MQHQQQQQQQHFRLEATAVNDARRRTMWTASRTRRQQLSATPLAGNVGRVSAIKYISNYRTFSRRLCF